MSTLCLAQEFIEGTKPTKILNAGCAFLKLFCSDLFLLYFPFEVNIILVGGYRVYYM